MLSQKGGTGKTTTVRTLADALRRAACTRSRSISTRRATCPTTSTCRTDVEPTIADVLSGRAPAGEAIQDDLIPANLSLAEAELMLGGKMGRELTLRRALAKCPRSMS